MKTNKDAVIIRERVYIPTHLVDTKFVKNNYVTRMYEDRACARCEHFAERHSYLCEECPAYLGKVVLHAPKMVNGISYLGIPVGDKRNFERKTGLLIKETTFVDRRIKAPFDYKIKFLAALRDYQTPVVEQFLAKKYGLLEAPPRTGKTLMSLYICLKLGQRTLMLANQHEFLTQFIDHIQGNEAEEIPKCTDLPELQIKTGKKLYGFPKTDADFENFQFFTMTYQQFLSEQRGQDRFRKIVKHVGTIFIDEVHRSNADGFAKVISMFPTRYKFGVTATVARKDNRHFIAKALLGPVVARSVRESLTPKVILHQTEAAPKKTYAGRSGWTYAMQFLAKDEKRNQMIVDWVMKDLRNGHNIVIPVMFKKHTMDLMQMINKEWGSKICETFIGGGGAKNKVLRKETLSRAKAGTTRVIVGIRSILQLGLNVPSWSAIYTAMPISNEPNYKQETSRIRTPMEGKRDPVIRLFVDMKLGQSIGCARNCVRQARKFGYEFLKTDKQRELMVAVMGHREAADPNSDAEQFKASGHAWEAEEKTKVPSVRRL